MVKVGLVCGPEVVRANEPTIESRSPAMTTRGGSTISVGQLPIETRCPDPPASVFPRIDISPIRVATRVPSAVAVPLSCPAPILTKNCTHGTAGTSASLEVALSRAHQDPFSTLFDFDRAQCSTAV